MEKQTFFSAIQQICEEKGISKDKVLETIEVAIAAAYKKDFGEKGQIIRAKMDPETGEIQMSQVHIVVDESMLKTEEEIAAEIEKRKEGQEIEEEEFIEGEEGQIKRVRFNSDKHIMFVDAKKIKKSIKVSDELITSLETRADFGRIAAQTAKQVILQRLKEAERETVYDEYKSRELSLVSGIVQRIERGIVFVDIGKVNGILYPEEQIIGEYYRISQRLRFLITEVKKEIRGPQIILSRAHPRLISKLFELEVPEIANGSVEVKSVAREAGSRSKIAVISKMDNLDPIGSCVGQKGTRVQAVINELGGEKIDIVEWSDDPNKYISNALAPAKVLDVELNKDHGIAKATVPADQLSLAIGKKGQNVRLAVKLTGWKIDIISSETGEKIEAEGAKEEDDKRVEETDGDNIVEEKETEIKEEVGSEENK